MARAMAQQVAMHWLDWTVDLVVAESESDHR